MIETLFSCLVVRQRRMKSYRKWLFASCGFGYIPMIVYQELGLAR